MVSRYSTEVRLLLDLAAWEVQHDRLRDSPAAVMLHSSHPWIMEELQLRFDPTRVTLVTDEAQASVLLSLFDDAGPLNHLSHQPLVIVGFINGISHKRIRYPRSSLQTHREISQRLRAMGYKIDRRWGIVGPRTIAQWIAAAAVARVGRYDWAATWSDRAATSLATDSFWYRWCGLGLVVGHK